MSQLSWFPFVTYEWRDIVRDLSIEEEGALLRAARTAWSAETPATLADRPAAWDNLLGSCARQLTEVVRRFFVPHPEHEGRLQPPWLTALYAVQLREVSAARSGGCDWWSGARREGRRCAASTAPSTLQRFQQCFKQCC